MSNLKTNKITSTRPTAEGIELTFERPFSLNGGLKLNRWWFSWDEFQKKVASSEIEVDNFQNLLNQKKQIEMNNRTNKLMKHVNKFNETFKVGSKVKVKDDFNNIVEWTVKAPADLYEGHTPVGYFKEHNTFYLLSKVIY